MDERLGEQQLTWREEDAHTHSGRAAMGID